MNRRPTFAAALLALCAPLAVLAETVDKDTPRSTPAGATFTVPAGWSVSAKGPLVVLRPPEGDLAAAIFDAAGAKDAGAAVAAAWAAYAGGAKWPLKLATPQAPRDGWEERKAFTYETSPNEKKTVVALAYRAAIRLDGPPSRRGGRHAREAGRAVLARGGEPATEGLREGVLRGKEGEADRRRDASRR